MEAAGLIQELQGSGFGAWARGSPYAYPAANLAHLLGLVLLVGGIGLLDLRLAGFWPRLPVADLAQVLIPLALAGLLILAPSGIVMFAADAEALSRSAVFRWKLALICLGIANALTFHLLWRARLHDWSARPPMAARAIAMASIGLWIVVAALGRLIAYS